MTSREQFEAWCNSDPDRSITMEDSTRFFCAWEVWQASREAVEVELPAAEGEEGGITELIVDLCSDAIRAAGIKVKGE